MKTFHHTRRSGEHWDYGKLAIATASTLGVITLGAFIYLLVWYIKRRLRTRRLHQESYENDQFDQSAVSLAEDTSRTLDDFLMKDIHPERSSIMFNRSRSPSISIVIEDADTIRCMSPLRPYLTQYDTTSSSNTNTSQTLTQESSPDELRSDQTQWSSSGQRSSSTTPRASTSSSIIPTSGSSQIWTTTTGTSEQTQSSSGHRSSTSTHRASISSSVVPTAGSSQIWTTTSAGTETFSLISQSSNSHQSPTSPTSSIAPRNPQVFTRRSNAASGASSRPSSVLQAASRMFNEAEAARMGYSRNFGSVGSMTPTPPVSPVLVDVAENDLPPWTSVPTTPFPFGQP